MKSLKITVIALLSLTLATVSCKKEEAPDQKTPTTQNDGQNDDQNDDGNGGANDPDTIISFLDLVDNIAADSTIVYDTTLAASNSIVFEKDPYDQSGITVLTSNGGGMTQNEFQTTGFYGDRLSGVRIYNEATSAFEVYTLVGTSAHTLYLDLSNGFSIVLGGTFVNTNGDTIVVPEIGIK